MKPDGIVVLEHARTPGQFLCLGVPSLGTITMEWCWAFIALQRPMNGRVYAFSVYGAEVGHARNQIVAMALAQEATSGATLSHVFFVDDDVLVPPQALLDLLTRQRPIVSGLYYGKTPAPQPLLFHGKYDGVARSWMPGELVECYAHGMGCTLIEARVFRAMYEQGQAVADPARPCPACHGAGCAGCFTTGHEICWFATTNDQVLVGLPGRDGPVLISQTEDVYFLERAAACGFPAAVDTGVFCWHIDGATHQRYPVKQDAEFRATGRITWETDRGPVTWPGSRPHVA